MSKFASEAVERYNVLMSATLENSYSRASGLPEAKKARLVEIIDEFVAQAEVPDTFDEDMKDPEYRAYVEAKAKQSEADRLAGNVFSGEEILRNSQARVKALHG